MSMGQIEARMQVLVSLELVSHARLLIRFVGFRGHERMKRL